MSLSDILQLSKIRLTTSVVFSAIAGFFIAGGAFNSIDLLYLVLGGFLVVKSNARKSPQMNHQRIGPAQWHLP